MDNRGSDGSQLEFGDDEQSVALRKAWDRTLRAIAPNLTATSQSFLSATEPISLTGNLAVLAAPSRFAREWLEKRYSEVLRAQLAHHLSLPEITIRFVLATAGQARKPLAPRVAGLSAPENEAGGGANGSANDAIATALVPTGPTQAPRATGARRKPLPRDLSMPLSPKFTFETFVVGKSNRLAHAGAMAVAENPGLVYNPLFLFGAPGLGKTHLMHAIGNAIQSRQPEARVAYVSGEAFTNGYINALRDRKSDAFRAVYRNVDVWLVDDIQTISGKEHTKEEFFHTFNTLHQSGKQIVLSSDQAPRDLRLMDERLRSRFESGLIADVAHPEIEMRVAILRKKALSDNLDIPDDVLMYMAGLIQSSIRAMEGALIRLIAYASMAQTQVTKELARDVLGSYFIERRTLAGYGDGEGALAGVVVAGEMADSGRSPLRALPLPPQISRVSALQLSAEEQCRHIIETVANHYEIDPAYIAGDNSAATARRREFATARQVAIYLSRERTTLPVTELARIFGGVNHSAISHAHKKMVTTLQSDPQLLGTIQALQRKLEE